MEAPKVSVIIPTHERRHVLGRALESALAQTFDQFEIIVVDDASEDGSGEIVAGFDDPRVHYTRHERKRGGGAARNTGIAAARGRYLAFLDDDDEWMPEKLAKQVRVLDTAPSVTGAVYSGYFILDEDGNAPPRRKGAVKRGRILDELLTRNCVGGTSAVMLKRECFERVGRFDEELTSFQDYDLWIRVAREFEFESIDEPLGNYYVHAKQIWTNLDAIERGVQRMVAKHGRARSMRRLLGRHYARIGDAYRERGDARNGMRAYIRAVRLSPLDMQHYRSIGILLLGRRNQAALKSGRDWIAGAMKRRSASGR